MTLEQRQERAEKDLGIIAQGLCDASRIIGDIEDKINLQRAYMDIKAARSELIRYTFPIQDASKILERQKGA